MSTASVPSRSADEEDTYRVTAGFAYGDISYDVYGSGNAADLKLPLEQNGKFFSGGFSRQVDWKVYLGPQFSYGNSLLTLRPNNNSIVPIPPDLGLHTTLTALGIQLTRDTRPNRFYPTGGTSFTFTSDFYSQRLGSKYSFQSYRTTFNKYWSMGKNQVVAYNAHFCATGGHGIQYLCFSDPPLGSFGNVGRDTIRGPGYRDWDSFNFQELLYFEENHPGIPFRVL